MPWLPLAVMAATLGLSAVAAAQSPNTDAAAPPPPAPPSQVQAPSTQPQQPGAAPQGNPQQAYPQQPQGYPQQYPQGQPYPQQQGYPQQYPQGQQYPQQQGYPQQYPQGQPYPQQYPQGQQYPQQYPQEQQYPQQYPQGQQYPQQYPPGYPQPGYLQGPAAGPPPPPPPPPSKCCRWSARFNPFDLLYRRLSFEAEVAIIGPLSVQISPTWIFNSPTENLETNGWALAGDVGMYFEGKALRGFWLKGHLGYESFDATVTHPANTNLKASKHVSSAIVGGMIGNTSVFGRNGGFSLSGGIGLGVALADPVTVAVDDRTLGAFGTTFYDKGGQIQILGTFGLGVTF